MWCPKLHRRLEVRLHQQTVKQDNPLPRLVGPGSSPSLGFLSNGLNSDGTFHLQSPLLFLSVVIYYNYIPIPCSHKLCQQKAILSYILEGPYIFLLTQQMLSHQRTVMIISKLLKAHKGKQNTHSCSITLVEDPWYTYKNSHQGRTSNSPRKTSDKCMTVRLQKTNHRR